MVSTNDDDAVVQNPSNLVLGVGIGTFTIFFVTMVLFFVWVFSIPCSEKKKITYRSYTILAWIIITCIFVFADRGSMYSSKHVINKVIEQRMHNPLRRIL